MSEPPGEEVCSSPPEVMLKTAARAGLAVVEPLARR
jgi:hypothetical protein